tara:strand:+ start:317 stop:571 length:255 start_codon:yes stop_codon:yes gene_type:complete
MVMVLFFHHIHLLAVVVVAHITDKLGSLVVLVAAAVVEQSQEALAALVLLDKVTRVEVGLLVQMVLAAAALVQREQQVTELLVE